MSYTPRRHFPRKPRNHIKNRRNRTWLILFLIMIGFFLMRYTVSKENLTSQQNNTITQQAYVEINQIASATMPTLNNELVPPILPKIVVDISEQTLTLYDDDQFIKEYDISSSKYGIGSRAGSNKTPLGQHVIAKKIGNDAPQNTIFRARVNTGKRAKIDAETEDLVTSRVMWLKGLEKGKNLGSGVDSYKRYIYIHGTPEESKIGSKASHGCIRMLNKEVIELFDLVNENTPVEIIR